MSGILCAMTQSEKELLLSWLANEKLRLDTEYLENLQRIRFRRSDITDFFEILIIQQRREDFDEFSKCLLRLLRL